MTELQLKPFSPGYCLCATTKMSLLCSKRHQKTVPAAICLESFMSFEFFSLLGLTGISHFFNLKPCTVVNKLCISKFIRRYSHVLTARVIVDL